MLLLMVDMINCFQSSCLEVSASSGEDEDVVAVDELGEDSDAVLEPDKPSYIFGFPIVWAVVVV